MQSIDNQTNLGFDTRAYFPHLYLAKLVLVVAPALFQATPFETLTAALAGTAIMTPPATISATDREVILRNIWEPFVVMWQYYLFCT